jgi:DNA-binding YbaB/EbfC family protein
MMSQQGGGGGPPGFDLGAMMQQAQELQAEMVKAQEAAKQKVVEATAGGGMVTVQMTGGLEVRKIKIDPSVVDAKDVGMLEDLIAAAVNQAVKKAQELTAAAMQAAMGPLGGMLPPGLL